METSNFIFVEVECYVPVCQLFYVYSAHQLAVVRDRFKFFS